MPLIPVVKREKEKEYILTHYEKLMLDLIPEEQLRSTDHNERWIDMMQADEARDANPEKTREDIYKGLENGDLERVLEASKNLTVRERQRIVQGLYNYLLNKKEMTLEDTKRLLLLTDNPYLSLVDLCVQLSKLKMTI